MREGIAVFEDLFFGGIGLFRATADVVFRPEAAVFKLAAVVYPEHARVDVTQRIQVNQTGADHGLAIVHRSVDMALEISADEFDAVAGKHHLAITPVHVRFAIKADDAASFQKGSHGHISMKYGFHPII